MAAQLRLYPNSRSSEWSNAHEPDVRISLRDLMPLIDMANRRNYLWLQDFLDDEVSVSSDLYEVLRAFRAYRPSA